MVVRDAGVRALALIGPTGSGKTALLEALLQAAGSSDRKVGDFTPEARARGHSVELNLAGFDFMGDHYAVVDCPGSLELAAESDAALAVVDLALIVAEPEAARAVLLQPIMRRLEALGTPRALFINKMDQARGSLEDLLTALKPVSAVPLVARQLPIIDNEKVTGYFDLALERAFVWRSNQASKRVEPPGVLATTKADARFHMLEQLADFDDDLMDKLLSDVQPDRDLVFSDLVREMTDGLIIPVFFGSALNGFGVRRLLKALRHEVPPPPRAAARLGIWSSGAAVIKSTWTGQAGKLAYARVFGAKLIDGAEITLPTGERGRVGGLSAIQGAAYKKIATGEIGDIVAIGKIDGAAAGDVLSLTREAQPRLNCATHPPLFALAITAANRKDDVRLSGALTRLLEEDTGLALKHDVENHQVLLSGQGEGHVRLALERLKRRYGVDVTAGKPATAYRETIRNTATKHARHKKQSGGHGQFADVTVEVKPRGRGEGFAFVSKITGGAIPKQWIPAVEQGVRDGLAKGPLGFPVVDLELTLLDGGFHAVDSSEMAFRIAGKLAIDEGLKACGSRLLEPIERLRVFAPSNAIANINAALSVRRGQILGFGAREYWPGWDVIDAYLPQSERHTLIAEIRSLTQGLGSYEATFDHLAELTGRAAEEVVSTAAGQ